MPIVKRYYYLLLTLLLLNFRVMAQQVYGNEWIVPGQSYYKIATYQTGMYAISATELQTLGAIGGSVNNMQLFHRGVEQNILIKDLNNNSIFDATDSLIFYGEQNDGTLDSILYNPSSAQPHKYYNLYSDTTAYFLTFGSAQGKRMQIVNNTASTSMPYHLNEFLKVYTDYYSAGKDYGQNGGDTYYVTGDYGEGYISIPFNGDGINTGYKAYPPITCNIPVTNLYTNTSVWPVLEIKMVGTSGTADQQFSHTPVIVFGTPSSYDTSIAGQVFTNQSTSIFTQAVNPKFIKDTIFQITVTCDPNDYMSYAYVKLTYPQVTDMQGENSKYFYLPANGQTSLLNITNVKTAYTTYDITNKDNINIIANSLVSDTLKVSVNSSSRATIYANANNNYLTPYYIKKVDLTDYTPSQYIIISHPLLISPGGQSNSGVAEYAAYRSSTAGGSYNTLIADVTKLYDLYSYGEETPVAMKRFIKYQYDKGNPQYLFIIGKGLSPGYSGNMPDGSSPLYRRGVTPYVKNFNPIRGNFIDLVPAYGNPGSDLLLSMGLDPVNPDVPALATGRLAASSDSVVREYFAKVQQHELLDSTSLWRKNLIHISGGNQDNGGSQIITFAGYLEELKPIAEDTLFGGKVIKSFVKSTANTVDETLQSNIVEVLNTVGAAYVTYFGHSSSDVTDVDLGYPSESVYGYNNKNLPFLVLNSCQAGDCFNGYSFVEDFLNVPNKGAIGAIAHSGDGYENTLLSYAQTFYDVAFRDGQTMHEPIGQIQREILKIYYNNYVYIQKPNVVDPIAKANAQEMIIQGDPALRVYEPSKPDFSIINNQTEQLFIKSYNGQIVTAVSDSFAIGIIVTNYGIVTAKDSFDVTVTRTYNNTTVTYGPLRFPPVYYQDTIYFPIKSKDKSTYGENTFTVTIDHLDKIPEMNKQNNEASFSYFVPFSGVTTLSPPEFSIVNSSMLNADKSLTLIAQSTDLTIEPTDYFIEIDTSYFFTSPYKKSTVINAPALVKWDASLLSSLQDSAVYYWRVRFNSIPTGEDTAWAQSSFIYISNSPPGWSQSKFPQFIKDNVNNISMGSLSQPYWQFNTVNTEITARGVGSSYTEPSGVNVDSSQWQSYMGTEMEVDGTPLYYGLVRYSHPCAGFSNIVNTVTFNRKTAEPYAPSFAGSQSCGITLPFLINFFYDPDSLADPGFQQTMINYVNAVQDGDYVLFYTTSAINFPVWSYSLKTLFKTEFGLSLIDSVQYGQPYMFLSRKGGKPIFEKYSTPTSSVYLDTIIVGREDSAYIASTIIGPATAWGTVYKTVKDIDTSNRYTVEVSGIDFNSNENLLINSVPSDTFNINNISATQYPYLQLKILESDTISLNAPQLKKWQVIFSQAPEGTLDLYKEGLQSYQYFSKQEGDTVSLSFIFENISAYNFPDSIKVKFTISNESGKTLTRFITLPPLKSDTSISFTYKFSTYGFPGNNTMEVFVNPKLQPEEYYDNNIVNIAFYVVKDQTAPVLDVVFDGNHIMDGDIVSPSPAITISLTDENKYLIKDDTIGMTLLLQSPGQATPERISLNNNPYIKYGQSGSNSNNFVIDYNPQNLRDGVYTLVVQGADVSGNNSGTLQYKIQFQVINESTVTNFYPYPNPFSTNTRFVFTLTGSDIPEDIIIEIINVTGKVVKELTKNDLGPIRIGNNITEPWNGTDEYGDRLANGLYLYKVKLKGNSGDFSHRETAADHAFKKGFGKLYILR